MILVARFIPACELPPRKHLTERCKRSEKIITTAIY
jgi:hypothetical protein